jgi:AraC family transcriptional regulator
MLDLMQPEILSQLLLHPAQLTSAGASWSHLVLAHYHQHPGHETPSTEFQQLALEVMAPQSWSNHERRLGTKLHSDRLRGGEMCLCPAQVCHWTAWDRPISFTVIAFDTNFVEDLGDQVLGCDRIEMLPQYQCVDPTIQHLVAALKADLAAGCPVGPLYGETFGTALAVHLLRYYSTHSSKTRDSQEFSPSTQGKLLDFIDAHLGEPIHLADLAQMGGFSRFHFARLFKQSFGLTPHQYVLNRRIERAKHLLQTSDLCIVEIALQCGFAHQSHLSRHFKRRVGLSPKAFRQL